MRRMNIRALAPILLIFMSACQKEREVEYKVTCGSCDITYKNSAGNTQQRSVSSTWSDTFNAEKDQFLYVSAQNNNQSGTVSVSIKCNGKPVDEASSSGAYVIATASGSAP